MRVEHVAYWTEDLERLKTFFVIYFGAIPARKYTNPAKGFASYFLSFSSGARIEIMTSTALLRSGEEAVQPRPGLAHLAISVGSDQAVDELTQRLRSDGYRVVDGPRRTGDGYYESVVLDPDGNRIEVTA
jgi:lactoylglutathione lyase